MPKTSLVIALTATISTLVALCTAQAGSVLSTIGPEELVFSYNQDACSRDDIPDAPARAFRDAEGRVHLFATADTNLSFIGPNLNAVKRSCQIVFRGGRIEDPAQFNNLEWLTSFWTSDGKTIYALVHEEYHPKKCPTNRDVDCWYNAITAAISSDGGYHFTRHDDGLIAAPAYQFNPEIVHPVGYFNPSNVVHRDGYYYALVGAGDIGAQKRGVCLLRTREVSRPGSWRGWDGRQFAARLANPYLEATPSPQVCAPIDPGHLTSNIWSLVQHRSSGRYLALMVRGGPHPAFYVSESADLFTWSQPRPVMDIATQQCGNKAQRVYPSLLDPNSPSRNFEDVGDTAYLYFTRLNFHDCKQSLDRDLLRVPVKITQTP
jgi:hypothetical protein